MEWHHGKQAWCPLSLAGAKPRARKKPLEDRMVTQQLVPSFESDSDDSDDRGCEPRGSLASLHSPVSGGSLSRGPVSGGSLASLPRTGSLESLAGLAEDCAYRGDLQGAALIYPMLLPYAQHAVMVSTFRLGSAERYLGKLAALLGRVDEACGHFERCIETNQRTGERLADLQIQRELAAVLMRRGNLGDRERAAALLDAAIRAAEGLTSGSVFRRDGSFYTVAFAGRVSLIKESKGMVYLTRLLREPDVELYVLELTGWSGAPELRQGSGGDALLDARAKAAYRERIEELREMLAEAERFGDLGRAQRARDELEAISAELGRALGLGGRDRRAASARERARASVTLAIRRAIAVIRQENPLLGAHLQGAVKTGSVCVYRPDSQNHVSWTV
jgi:tetratricopeptide (TPR) repeat protein